jgi:hypothetical protein
MTSVLMGASASTSAAVSAFHVVWEGGHNEVHPRQVHEVALEAVVVLRAPMGDAGRRTDHERDGTPEHERDFGCLVGNLVHCPEGKVDEVQVDDRVHTGHRGTHAERDHGRLRDWGIEHPARPNDIYEPSDLCPVTAAVDEISADDEDIGVRSHLLGHALCEPSRVCKFFGHFR